MDVEGCKVDVEGCKVEVEKVVEEDLVWVVGLVVGLVVINLVVVVGLAVVGSLVVVGSTCL
mgnify:CR=1 FL=1